MQQPVTENLRPLAIRIESLKLAPDVILAWQAEIHRRLLMLSRVIDRPNFTRISNDDVSRMAQMYDEFFFEGTVLPQASAEGIAFGISSRMTRVAGKLVTHYGRGRNHGPRKFELVLSSTLLFQTFADVDRTVVVTGRPCRDRLEAMQRVFEHEFTHLIEMLIWNCGNCSESRFQSIAKRAFGHTDYHHDLMTQRERAARKFDIRVGDRVRFDTEHGALIGRVNRITRRATVLVPDAKGEAFSDGGRYLRFYVPLERLKKLP
jgi:hypothetical protein